MQNQSLALIPFAFPNLPQVCCCFTTAIFGNISLDVCADDEKERSMTISRRFALAGLTGFSRWTELRQVHGEAVLADVKATPLDEPSTLEADGLASSKSGHALLVKVADCQPILLAHRSGRRIAALHCGWRGSSFDFPGRGLAAFCRFYDLKPEDVLAVRGPSLGPGAAEFINFDQEWPDNFRPWFNPESRLMDLWSLTRHQLLQAGMLPEHIFSLDLCTYALGGDGGCLFSFRRGDALRQGALIFIRP
ncbi:MAG: polyphenol oxidase family protein [Deltaproteobacteria bacterium]|nr:polyphenol oxidase family protein [Deltaproteobacteria bacterium]